MRSNSPKSKFANSTTSVKHSNSVKTKPNLQIKTNDANLFTHKFGIDEKRKSNFVFKTMSTKNLKRLSIDTKIEELAPRYNNLCNQNSTTSLHAKKIANQANCSKKVQTVKSKYSNSKLLLNNLSQTKGSFVSTTPRNPYTEVFNEFKNFLKMGSLILYICWIKVY